MREFPRLLTRRQLSVVAGVSVMTVTRWRRAGMPAAIDRGRIVKFDWEVVSLWLRRDPAAPKASPRRGSRQPGKGGRPRNVVRG